MYAATSERDCWRNYVRGVSYRRDAFVTLPRSRPIERERVIFWKKGRGKKTHWCVFFRPQDFGTGSVVSVDVSPTYEFVFFSGQRWHHFFFISTSIYVRSPVSCGMTLDVKYTDEFLYSFLFAFIFFFNVNDLNAQLDERRPRSISVLCWPLFSHLSVCYGVFDNIVTINWKWKREVVSCVLGAWIHNRNNYFHITYPWFARWKLSWKFTQCKSKKKNAIAYSTGETKFNKFPLR